ncbi:MAG: UDP-N-acetylmuramoyl-L-alanyl-D-glutamate--2,6-diaminopimelate ligase, partial [Clostridia bacterium]|nr:UDP-N-acetylmuramoyl-L-alanyl-D-glutamate--2,6-diaminopimelate ligase [Clostridia bacterium]
MYIQQIINGLKCQVVGTDNPDVTNLSCDTSTVTQGSLFFCLKGQQYDGHNFFRKVIGDGAVAIVTERKLDTSLLQIIVPNTRIA